MKEMWVQSLGWKDPLEKEMATHSSILAGKPHGQRSLVGYSPWGRKESDAIENACAKHVLDWVPLKHCSHCLGSLWGEMPKAVTRAGLGTRRRQVHLLQLRPILPENSGPKSRPEGCAFAPPHHQWGTVTCHEGGIWSVLSTTPGCHLLTCLLLTHLYHLRKLLNPSKPQFAHL